MEGRVSTSELAAMADCSHDEVIADVRAQKLPGSKDGGVIYITEDNAMQWLQARDAVRAEQLAEIETVTLPADVSEDVLCEPDAVEVIQPKRRGRRGSKDK